MTRQQSLWLFIWIFIFFVFFCLWHKLPYFVSQTAHENPQKTLTQAPQIQTKDMHFKLFKRDDSVTISGIVSDEEAKAKIVDAFGKIFSHVDADGLLIDTKVKNDQLLTFFTNFANTFSTFETGYLSYDNQHLEIEGSAKHKIAQQRLQEQLETLHGIQIDNKVTIKTAKSAHNPPQSLSTQKPLPKKREEIQQEIKKLLKTQKVHFLYARDILTKESQKLVDDIITLLKENSHISLEIAGHTDSDGTRKNNLALSQKRAESIKKYMVRHGISADRLEAKGYGESRPLVPNTSRKNKQINRRVEFTVKGE